MDDKGNVSMIFWLQKDDWLKSFNKKIANNHLLLTPTSYLQAFTGVANRKILRR